MLIYGSFFVVVAPNITKFDAIERSHTIMNDQVGPLKEIIEKLLNEYVSKKDESIKEQTNKNNDQNNIIEAVYKEHPDWKNKIENKTDMYKEE